MKSAIILILISISITDILDTFWAGLLCLVALLFKCLAVHHIYYQDNDNYDALIKRQPNADKMQDTQKIQFLSTGATLVIE